MDVGAMSVVADSFSNSYVLGGFAGTSITFGSITLTAVVGPTVSGDIFLVKYNATGNVIWAKNMGGDDYDGANEITHDAFGNLYVVGWFYSDTVIIGSDTLINAGVPNFPSGTADIFLAKYDTAGNMLWAKRAGGTLSDSACSVSADAFGNVYVAGTFKSSSITFGSTTLTNVGDYDMFIVKYDATGNVLWAKNAGGNLLDFSQSISTDASGNSYVAGGFRSATITFGSTTLTNTNIGWDEIFLVKYDAFGNVIWAKSATGIIGDFATSVSTDGSGNAYMVGYFYSATITFGSYTLNNGGAGSTVFIAKYDSFGNVLWAKSAGGTNGFDMPSSVATDTSGNAYVTGKFQSDSIIFGSTTLYTPNNSDDIFVVKYDTAGNVPWAIRAGGNAADVPQAIDVDPLGNIYVAGSFESPTISFGSTTLTTSGGVPKMFLAKLGSVTGIAEANNEYAAVVYPNPTTGVFMLDAGGQTTDAKQITIYSVYGECVYSSSVIGHQSSVGVDLSSHPDGIYFVRVNTEKGIISKKVVVLR